MAYEKKLCILKQIGKGFTADGMPLMGAVYAERLGSDLTLTPRIAGLAPLREGRYALPPSSEGREYCLELKGNTALRVPACPSLENGFAVLLCFVKEEIEPVAFGSCGSAPSDYKQLVDLFRSLPKERASFSSPAPAQSAANSEENEGQRIPPMPLPPTGVPGVPGPNTPFAPGVPLPSGPSDKPLPPEPPPEEDEPSPARPRMFLPKRAEKRRLATATTTKRLREKITIPHPKQLPPSRRPKSPPAGAYILREHPPAHGGSLSKGHARHPPLPRSAPFGVDAVGGRAPRRRLSLGRSPLCVPCGGGAGRAAPRDGRARGVRALLSLFGRRGLLRRLSGRRNGEFVK